MKTVEVIDSLEDVYNENDDLTNIIMKKFLIQMKHVLKFAINEIQNFSQNAL